MMKCKNCGQEVISIHGKLWHIYRGIDDKFLDGVKVIPCDKAEV